MSQDTHHTPLTDSGGPSPEECEWFIADAVLRYVSAVAPELHLTDESAHNIAVVMATQVTWPDQLRFPPWNTLPPDFCKKLIAAAVVLAGREMGGLITWEVARLVAESMAEKVAKHAHQAPSPRTAPL
ncbi:MAG TPA: hypothetical protein VMD79_07840 [Solirubrobacteraceae bacterium]|nr:hypothetical protein [Solirubrobacteraceae bacterium]